jgi:hypothetical protein
MSGPSYQDLKSFYDAHNGQPNPDDPHAAQSYDMSQETPVEHRFDCIVGNELRCSLHNGQCNVIIIKPTQVLEKGSDGLLHLIDKAPVPA